jgi:hypothetical protein
MKSYLIPLLLILFLSINLVFIFILRRKSQSLGGSPPGFYIYHFLKNVKKLSERPEGKGLKQWILAYLTINVIAFTILMILLALTV